MLHRFFPSLLATLALGCLSGQTGSPDCVGPRSCICDPLYSSGALLRVHVTSYEAGQLEATVDEVFASQAGAYGITTGDRLGGVVLGERPCAAAAASEIEVGGELFVSYGPGLADGLYNCSAFQACADASCAKLSEPALTDCWNDCSTSTEQKCTELRRAALLDGAFLFAVPWSDTLSFGADHDVPRSELAVFASPESCLERFPAPPAPPCDDTRGSLTCSATPPARPSSSVPAWPLSLAVFGLLCAARRARRKLP
ncbi:MAG TPA: hypothetical protein VEQ59_21595 [Polyangiaceae bacterium]|nr:hypothetical protein [Polyangiaceae bacterium]